MLSRFVIDRSAPVPPYLGKRTVSEKDISSARGKTTSLSPLPPACDDKQQSRPENACPVPPRERMPRAAAGSLESEAHAITRPVSGDEEVSACTLK